MKRLKVFFALLLVMMMVLHLHNTGELPAKKIIISVKSNVAAVAGMLETEF